MYPTRKGHDTRLCDDALSIKLPKIKESQITPDKGKAKIK